MLELYMKRFRAVRRGAFVQTVEVFRIPLGYSSDKNHDSL